MITNRLVSSVTLAAAFLAVVFGLKAAQNASWLDAETTGRIVQVLIGLSLAAYANLMPKQIGSAKRSPLVQARTQAALRVGGWAFSLAGLAYAALWAFAPLPFADTASMVPVAGAMVVTLGYAIWCYAACRAAGSATASR
jgi:hypothetical protein